MDVSWKEKLGEEIRRARNRKGMSREELLDALKSLGFSISLTSIGNYERGERAPDFEDLRQIAAALKEDHFQVDERIRIEFSANGRARLEPQFQQLDLDFDQNGGVTVRIESAKNGVRLRKISA